MSLFKPASFLYYFLVIIVFFLLGLIYADLTGAGDNQGLAAAAIVLGYGAISAFAAFVISLFIAYRAEVRTIVVLNKILGVVAAGLIGYFVWNYYTNIYPKRKKSPTEINEGKKTVKPTVPAGNFLDGPI